MCVLMYVYTHTLQFGSVNFLEFLHRYMYVYIYMYIHRHYSLEVPLKGLCTHPSFMCERSHLSNQCLCCAKEGIIGLKEPKKFSSI